MKEKNSNTQRQTHSLIQFFRLCLIYFTFFTNGFTTKQTMFLSLLLSIHIRNKFRSVLLLLSRLNWISPYQYKSNRNCIGTWRRTLELKSACIRSNETQLWKPDFLKICEKRGAVVIYFVNNEWPLAIRTVLAAIKNIIKLLTSANKNNE